MWRTQHGDRILKGAEARVFAEALLNLLDEVTEFDFDAHVLHKSEVEAIDALRGLSYACQKDAQRRTTVDGSGQKNGDND